jgi:hypothetical protein
VERTRASRRHPEVRRETAIRIDLARRKGQHQTVDGRLGNGFEGGQKIADVGRGRLDVRIAGNDVQDNGVFGRVRRGRDRERFRRRRQAGERPRTAREPGFGDGAVE